MRKNELVISKILLVLFCMVFCSDSRLFAQQALYAFLADVTYTASGETGTGKIYSDGHSVRIELEGRLHTQNEISFVRLDSGLGQALIPFMSAYIEYPYGNSADAEFVRYLPDAKVQSRSLGSDLVDGQICEKVLIMASYRGNTYSSIEWRSRSLPLHSNATIGMPGCHPLTFQLLGTFRSL